MRNEVTISRDKVKDTIKSIKKGSIFSVRFVKKDGSLRKICTMNGTSRGVKGVGMSFDPDKKGLIPMYDLQLANKEKDPQKAWRMVNVNTVTEIHAERKVYVVF